MPVYVYEPVEHDCGICDGRIEVVQGLNDEPYSFCPWCGFAVRRLVAPAAIKVQRVDASPDQAAKKGFTTFRKAGKGVWERIAGEGPDAIVGTPEDIAAVEAEKKKP